MCGDYVNRVGASLGVGVGVLPVLRYLRSWYLGSDDFVLLQTHNIDSPHPDKVVTRVTVARYLPSRIEWGEVPRSILVGIPNVC